MPREKDKAQRYSRWFTVWPSTHVNAGRTVEVMPVSEHEQFVASLNQSEPGSAYFTSPAMKRLADEHADLCQRVYALAQTIRGMCTDEEPYPLIDAKLAELGEIVNPQEDE